MALIAQNVSVSSLTSTESFSKNSNTASILSSQLTKPIGGLGGYTYFNKKH